MSNPFPIERSVKPLQSFREVKPGSFISADARVIHCSRLSVDESMLTGEPLPVDKKPGDGVAAGTINGQGTLTFVATRVGRETALAQIIRLVQEAQGSKAPIQALADRVAVYWVDADPAGGALLREIRITPQGDLEDWPEGVFYEDFEEVLAIRRAGREAAET